MELSESRWNFRSGDSKKFHEPAAENFPKISKPFESARILRKVTRIKARVASPPVLSYALPPFLTCTPARMNRNSSPARKLCDASVAGFVIAAVGAATIAGAWFFQYVIGLVPCPLCYEQRTPYYLAIPLSLAIGLLAHNQRRTGLARILLLVVAAIFAYGAALGVYHAGVEWKWWAGPTTCTSAGTAAGGSLLSQMQGVRVVPCDVVQWTFLGLSLAGYNALIAGALTLYALFAAAAAAKK